MEPPVDLSAATVVWYSNETGNRVVLRLERERERNIRKQAEMEKPVVKCLDTLQGDQKMVAGSTSVSWILEFNSRSWGATASV